MMRRKPRASAGTLSLAVLALGAGCADIFGLDEVTLGGEGGATVGTGTTNVGPGGADATTASQGGAGPGTSQGSGGGGAQGGGGAGGDPGNGGSGGAGGDSASSAGGSGGQGNPCSRGTGGGGTGGEGTGGIEEVCSISPSDLLGFGNAGDWDRAQLGPPQCVDGVDTFGVQGDDPSMTNTFGDGLVIRQSTCIRATVTASAGEAGLQVRPLIGANGFTYRVPSIDLPVGLPGGSSTCRVPATFYNPTVALYFRDAAGGAIEDDATITIDDIDFDEVGCEVDTPRCEVLISCDLHWDTEASDGALKTTNFADAGQDGWSVGQGGTWEACTRLGCTVNAPDASFALDEDFTEAADLPAGTCVTFELEASVASGKATPAMGSSAGSTLYGEQQPVTGSDTWQCQVPHDVTITAGGFLFSELSETSVRLQRASIEVVGPCCAPPCDRPPTAGCAADLDFFGELSGFTDGDVISTTEVAGYDDCAATRFDVQGAFTMANLSGIGTVDGDDCLAPYVLGRGDVDGLQLVLTDDILGDVTFSFDIVDHAWTSSGASPAACNLPTGFVVDSMTLAAPDPGLCRSLDLDRIRLAGTGCSTTCTLQ